MNMRLKGFGAVLLAVFLVQGVYAALEEVEVSRRKAAIEGTVGGTTRAQKYCFWLLEKNEITQPSARSLVDASMIDKSIEEAKQILSEMPLLKQLVSSLADRVNFFPWKLNDHEERIFWQALCVNLLHSIIITNHLQCPQNVSLPDDLKLLFDDNFKLFRGGSGTLISWRNYKELSDKKFSWEEGEKPSISELIGEISAFKRHMESYFVQLAQMLNNANPGKLHITADLIKEFKQFYESVRTPGDIGVFLMYMNMYDLKSFTEDNLKKLFDAIRWRYPTDKKDWEKSQEERPMPAQKPAEEIKPIRKQPAQMAPKVRLTISAVDKVRDVFAYFEGSEELRQSYQTMLTVENLQKALEPEFLPEDLSVFQEDDWRKIGRKFIVYCENVGAQRVEAALFQGYPSLKKNYAGKVKQMLSNLLLYSPSLRNRALLDQLSADDITKIAQILTTYGAAQEATIHVVLFHTDEWNKLKTGVEGANGSADSLPPMTLPAHIKPGMYAVVFNRSCARNHIFGYLFEGDYTGTHTPGKKEFNEIAHYLAQNIRELLEKREVRGFKENTLDEVQKIIEQTKGQRLDIAVWGLDRNYATNVSCRLLLDGIAQCDDFSGCTIPRGMKSSIQRALQATLTKLYNEPIALRENTSIPVFYPDIELRSAEQIELLAAEKLPWHY